MNAQFGWLNESVEVFFSTLDWRGLSTPKTSTSVQAPALNLTQTVTVFFQAIPWDGVPKVGQVPASPAISQPPSRPETSATIDDLVNLF